ncbi:PREDICTED: prolyl endopeptidase FAP-like [Priapulus caudatus]|uniref:Prolyl endopeptidase FAP-like n=1 Tax=Priapulus caudatus TaxID=37621 RepID=A0ABM1EB38_PRICU|nr:PREDICTED: prolyl endopeptidase FAP-like [Priapulus caudatus]
MAELRMEDQASFFNFLRMPPEMFDELLVRIGPRIQKQDTRYRKALEPGLKLAVTISLTSKPDCVRAAYSVKLDKVLLLVYDELVDGKPDERNWRGIGIAVLVILVVFAMIITAVAVFTPEEIEGPQGDRLTFDQIFTDEFSTTKYSTTWITDDEFVYRDEDGALIVHNARLNKYRTLMDNSTFVMVHDNDIYYKENAWSTMKPFRITYRGEPGVIFNGIPDWLYEEEMLNSHVALWWSPSGHRLCYATFNDTNVKSFYLPEYGEGKDHYTTLRDLRYPKAGDTNPTFILNVLDVRNPYTVSGGRREAREVPITHGTFDVTDIVGYNEKTRLVYYVATGGHQEDARRRHLWSVGTPQSNRPYMRECLTCHLKRECQYYSAYFSKRAQYYTLHCRGPGIPRWTLHSVDQVEPVAELCGYTDLRRSVERTALPKKMYFQVSVSHHYRVNVEMILPVDYREAENVKYPLLINAGTKLSGGPDTQKVHDRFEVDWSTYLASRHGIAVAYIDGRGSSCRGNALKFEIYRRFGRKEVDDQLAVTRHIRDTFRFIDPKKIAIWGWSYGGYLAAKVLSHKMNSGGALFKCGMAIAPITNWRLYDTAFTERYMGLPDAGNNLLEYEVYVSSEFANKYARNVVSFIRGVPINTIEVGIHSRVENLLQASSTKANVYPDQNHDIHETNKHLHLLLDNHLHNCFKDPIEKEDEEEIVVAPKPKTLRFKEAAEAQQERHRKKTTSDWLRIKDTNAIIVEDQGTAYGIKKQADALQ